VYQIGSSIAHRNLFQYLFVGDNTVLLDTGASNTPSETILPFLKQIGIWRSLEKSPEGVTLQACMDECGPAFGAWPANNQRLPMYPLHGHLLHLEQKGRVTKLRGEGQVQWKIAN